MVFLLLMQAVAGPVVPAAPRPRSDAPCPVVADGNDVVVCGRDDERYRLRPLPQGAERPALPQAAARVFGDAKLSLEGEQASDGHGGAVNRAMIRLTIPFGAKKKRSTP